MPSDTALDPVCAVCSRSIPPGTALTFMRRGNVIHDRCLIAAQRRAEAPAADNQHRSTLRRAED